MSFTVAKEFMAVAVNNGAKTTMAKKGTLTLKKAAPAKKAGSGIFQKKKARAPAKKSATAGGRGTAAERQLWLPNTQPPEWLDGSMIGDRGFDPLGLGKPVEYYLFELDALEQNDPVNKSGNVFASLTPDTAAVSEDSLQPYNEVFDIQRFRECELIHGRWAMLGVTGAVSVENGTGINWWEAGTYCTPDDCTGIAFPGAIAPLAPEGSGYPSYWAVIAVEIVLMGAAEGYRTGLIDPVFDELAVGDANPGGRFDPLNLAESGDLDELKLKELKHCRLAMGAWQGCIWQAIATQDGPVANWRAHIQDPVHANLISADYAPWL